MAVRACLIPGDGAGPELVEAARCVLEASGAELEWDVHEVGAAAYEREGSALPERVVESIRERRLALKGPVATPVDAPFRSVNVELRERLDLYLGVRPSRTLAAAGGAAAALDVVVIRMTHGDLYAGLDYAPDDAVATGIRAAVLAAGGPAPAADAGISVKAISAAASERAARAALDWARRNGRRRVTVVHKANVMRHSDGTFLAAARRAAATAVGLELDDRLVDSACADLVRAPGRCDVLLAPMLYGDILSDVAAAVCGGLGIAPGANLGDDCAVFEAVHGTVAKHAGTGRANPIGLILSGAMMLRQAGELDAADRVELAVADSVRDGRALTYDLAPAGSTSATTDVVAEAIRDRLRG